MSPFEHLPAAEALFLELPKRAGGGWLEALRQALPISNATGKTESAAAIGFTWTGLETMGLDGEALATFSAPFQEGMHQVDRQRRLGDDIAFGAVVSEGAQWSGNTPDPYGGDKVKVAAPTPITVHVALLLYAADDAALEGQLVRVRAQLESTGVRIAHHLRLSLRKDRKGIAREHFGFADGMSQPVPFGDGIVSPTGSRATDERKWHGVAAGEILLGHLNAHQEPAPGPQIKAASDGASALPTTGSPEGFRNLGLDGSYLVIRELRQDVAAFWNSLDREAKAIGDPKITADWLAERIVGRTVDGDPLAPDGTVPPQGGQPANLFGFAEKDVHGLGCPLGSHIRRANPRDSLPSRDGPNPSLSATPALLAAAKGHRILRRGRKYGTEIADPRVDDGRERGLLFMCLNSDIARHFEFVQQTWLLNQSFATLFDETDPLLGPRGPFTIPARPVRLCPNVETYVRFVGGEYFFLPSIPALDYLGGLSRAAVP